MFAIQKQIKMERTVKKQIDIPLSLSIKLKEEVLFQMKKGSNLDERDLCIELIKDGLLYRKNNRN